MISRIIWVLDQTESVNFRTAEGPSSEAIKLNEVIHLIAVNSFRSPQSEWMQKQSFAFFACTYTESKLIDQLVSEVAFTQVRFMQYLC